VEACAETLFDEGRAFAPETRDASGSLDTLHTRAGVRQIRALFRRPDGRPLSQQRARLRAKLERRRSSNRGPSGPPLPDLSHIYLVETDSGLAPGDALALYAEDPHVAWVQPNHTQSLDALPGSSKESAPNDPFFHSSGSWGQAFADLWGLNRVRAPEAWSAARGQGVVVAVVDTGIDYHHPDIAGNIWVNPGEDLDGNGRVDPKDWNGIDDDNNGFIDDLRGFDFANSLDGDADGDYDGPLDYGDSDPFDDRGHGTHVAGTIGAVANNGIGLVGVAPEARIMALKGFPAQGDGLDSDLWRAVLYAADNGARVVNASWSCSPLCPRNPLAENVVRTVSAMGVVVVTSAGNRSIDVISNSPENTRDVITVASSGEDDRPSASFTNHGWLIDLAAPGGGPSNDPNVYVGRRNILSLRSSADAGSAPFAVGDGYSRAAGTSMAAPHVSGAAAILLSAQPDLSYDDVRRALRQGAVDLGSPGHDRELGAGRLDIVGGLERLPLPDLHAALASPRAGSVFRPGLNRSARGKPSHPRAHRRDDRRNRVPILGTARGQDMLDYTLSVGLGNDPTDWRAITPANASAVADGLLGTWDITDAEEGTYLIRLEVRGSRGESYREFIPLSLERGRFAAISSPGPPALAPALSGRVVAWQSLRDEGDPPGRSGDWNLFASHLFSGRQSTLEAGPNNAQKPSISSSRTPSPRSRGSGRRSWVASWNATEPGAFQVRGYGCRQDPASGLCPAFEIDSGAPVFQPPVSAQGRIFWIDANGGLRACEPDPLGERCVEYDLGLTPARRGFLRSDGQTLSWIDSSGGQRVGFCRLDPKTGACPAQLTRDAISPYSRVTVSGNLMAWVKFNFRGNQPLLLCEFQPSSGACPPIEVAPHVRDTTPRLSGRRLVWDGQVGDEASDVFFCEYDPVLARCPAQRVTAEMTTQAHSDLDGRQLVWQDERAGSSTIFGTTLPVLAPLAEPEKSVAPGEALRVRVRADRNRRGDRDSRGRRAPTIALEVHKRVGEDWQPASASALGIRVLGSRAGRAQLRWRPRSRDVGLYAFTFSATNEVGLIARQTMTATVETPPAAPGWPTEISEPPRSWRGLWAWLMKTFAGAPGRG
jgi:subtilisin family serine protease